MGIAPVVNSTTQPGLAEQLNDALPQAFNSDRNLRVTNVEAANLVLTATVGGYTRDAASYTGDQAVSAYKVTVSAQVEVRDQVRDEDVLLGHVPSALRPTTPARRPKSRRRPKPCPSWPRKSSGRY